MGKLFHPRWNRFSVCFSWQGTREIMTVEQPSKPTDNPISSPPANTGGIDNSSAGVFHDALEHLDVGIIIVHHQLGRLIYRNAAAVEVLADLMEEVDYPAVHDLLLKASFAAEDLHRPLELRSGNCMLGYTVYDIGENRLCIFIRDTTEKSRLMAIAEAVNTMNNIGYVFSGIRHEIGNPINSIKMTMSVLKHRLGEFSPEMIEEYVDRTLSEIARVEYLLKSLRNFSMFENIEVRPLDLADFLKKFVFISGYDMEKRGIALRAEIPKGKIMVKADARALQQVLLNLLANASAALEGRGEQQILLTLKQSPSLVTLGVRDNGCGMSVEEQGNLFKPFFTTKAEGSGLGLVICRKMLAQMNSSIDVQSAAGEGTTVKIALPVGGDHGR
jgi:signal transduction histidine kinase